MWWLSWWCRSCCGWSCSCYCDRWCAAWVGHGQPTSAPFGLSPGGRIRTGATPFKHLEAGVTNATFQIFAQGLIQNFTMNSGNCGGGGGGMPKRARLMDDYGIGTPPPLLALIRANSAIFKCAILLVFVAQSTSHRCKSYVGFLFSISMGLYTPKTRKWCHFLLKCTHFNHQAHASSALAV